MTNKILVTGGAGYIGSVLINQLLQNGYSVRVLDIFLFGGESLLHLQTYKNLEIINGDIRDRATLKSALKGVTDVIHLAALVGEPACKENPEVTKQINLEATKTLAKLSKLQNVNHFIFTSTCSNYGISSPDAEATEKSDLYPLSLYAETKIASENYLLSLTDKKFKPTILRLATIFGLSPRMRFNLMLNEFAREVVLGNKISVRNENAWRPFLHTKDISDAINLTLKTSLSKVGGEIYNIVGENIQKQYLAFLAKKYNPKINIIIEEGNSGDRRDYRVSADKFRKRIHWQPKISIEEGFKEITEAIKMGIFLDPYEFKYNGWYNKKILE
ncbi:MAG: NAD(P)-dependent oxidoreductase [Candidatus Gottesmanbacteria bacterium]